MLLFKRTTDIHHYLQLQRSRGKAIGFVPTMGALHQGHLSLIEASQADNNCTVCSIFVNPTQFNDPEDLKKYPRPITKDIQLLEASGTDLLFWPEVKEIYPDGTEAPAAVDIGSLDQPMEGRFRPGHFQGVVQVVRRLLDIVRPHRLYMGQKDYQQYAIIRKMLEQVHTGVIVVRSPIIREKDGLAMSSRNVRLTPALRKDAPILYKVLNQARSEAQKLPLATVKANALRTLAGSTLRPEYFEIVDGQTLAPVDSLDEADTIVACTAAWAGNIRLIDNMILKE